MINSQDSPFPPFAELIAMSNFSFHEGASHPEEIVSQAATLGYRAIALTDRNSLAGIVRAHTAAHQAHIPFIVGVTLDLILSPDYLPEQQKQKYQNLSPPSLSLCVYPICRTSYGTLCRLLSRGKRRAPKDQCEISFAEFLPFAAQFFIAIAPLGRELLNPSLPYAPWDIVKKSIRELLLHEVPPKHLALALHRGYTSYDHSNFCMATMLARQHGLSLLATSNARYHTQERKRLHDILTCIKHKTTITRAGFLLTPNSQNALLPPNEMYRLFREIPEALHTTLFFAEATAHFSLDQLTYSYPLPHCPPDSTPQEYLRHLVYRGAQRRYPHGIPEGVVSLLEEELTLIKELGYEKYFLTCADIVTWARGREILCQGRGAAANSAVCFCLGITSVDPTKIDLLFGRFISKERDEPPDIDIDFEHERREEVIQYIYDRYGRDHAALTAAVITYRQRSAVRDVGKALGLPERVVATLCKSIHRWTSGTIAKEAFEQLGVDSSTPTIHHLLTLAEELQGFPRHLTQHVGGFVISESPLSEIVPIANAGMESRTIIEWDKDDIEALGILKIDVLALGMLTCIRKCLATVNQRRRTQGQELLSLATIPPDDTATYDMLRRADTIGVFQVESRAQMSMLPRLRPRCFYDLVIQVAIVRPGPIQGDMVHPYLRRRSGREKVAFPDDRVARILGKTLGVPLFQEQAMRLAIVLANFSPGEAEQLRRAMAAWKRHDGIITIFKERIICGMVESGYSIAFAETCMHQIKGFSEYGFPESHAASFALLVYASAWLKCHYPADFAAALLNSQPMGFYAPSQIITDAKRHHVEVLPVDVNFSEWDCTVAVRNATGKDTREVQPHDTYESPQGRAGEPYLTKSAATLRIGMRFVQHLGADPAESIYSERLRHGPYTSIEELWLRISSQRRGIKPHQWRQALLALARADAFTSLGLTPREATWAIKALPDSAPTLRLTTPLAEHAQQSFSFLPPLSERAATFLDYSATGFSLKGHPIHHIRTFLRRRGALCAEQLRSVQHGRTVSLGGISLIRQRPGTARGVVFITLEDETGLANLVIRPSIFTRYQHPILTSLTLFCTGRIERTGDVVYLNVSSLEGLDATVFGEESELREHIITRSYSY